jgi:hypothetical protein
MTKARCPNCKEFPYRWTRRYSDTAQWGLSCSNCAHFRIPIRRASPKRDARDARIAALIAELAA